MDRHFKHQIQGIDFDITLSGFSNPFPNPQYPMFDCLIRFDTPEGEWKQFIQVSKELSESPDFKDLVCGRAINAYRNRLCLLLLTL